MLLPEIPCPYCGGAHSAAAAVRACWKAAQLAAQPMSGLQGDRSAGRSARFLGRSMVVSPGGKVAEPWAGAPRLQVHGGLRAPDSEFTALENAYLSRKPVIIELEDDLGDHSPTESAPVWSIGPQFCFPAELLRHLVWSNSLDGRGEGEPLWELTGRALALGASPGADSDVVLPDGRPAFLDGGPLAFFTPGPSEMPEGVVVPRITLEQGSLSPLRTNFSEAELAADQLAAVTHNGGAARIIAPAGSGKTRVLTERARHLLRSWQIPADAVCLVAFNKRAADEIRQRTADLPDLQVRTLNSLALAIVSGSGRFGSAGSVETVDERTVRSILESLISFPRRVNADPAAAWIEALSAVRLGLRAPALVEAEFGGDVDGLPQVFDRYREALRTRHILDFDEQIYRALEILLTDSAARATARKACRMMLVDEFQDLTPAHLLLIRMLAGPEGCVYGVGDDDQTIYGYAGASPEWLIDYQSLFPGSGSHSLEINYRCPPQVVHAARTLLTHNRRRVEKAIRAAPLRKELPDELEVTTTDDPVQAAVDAVKQRVYCGTEPSSIAVLTRVNNSLAPIQLALNALEIPANRAVDARYLERSGVGAALAWLRLASRPERFKAADIGFTARRPPRAMSPKVIEWMGEQRSVSGIQSLAARLSDRDRAKVDDYAADLELLIRVAENSTAQEFFETLRDKVGLAASLAALDSQRRRLDRSPQADDLDVLIDIARLHPPTEDFEKWLRDGLGAPGDPFGVVLATVHAVKGREWDHVIVHNASLGLLPHRLAEDTQEERRVFHVALTRSRKSTTVIGGPAPSPFLEQMNTEWDPAAQPPPGAPVERPARGEAMVGPRDVGTEAASKMLRAWRADKAKSESRPAFTIMHDSTLESIAESKARTLGDLARIKGIGPTKLEAFGDEILALLDTAYIWGSPG